MNRWSDRTCPNGCGVRVYQLEPGGRWFRPSGAPHKCPAPAVPVTLTPKED